MANQSTKSDTNEHRTTKNYQRRNYGHVDKRSNKESSTVPSTIYFNNIYSPQKDRGFQTGVQSEKAEQICEIRAFQDGINSNDKTANTKRQLDDLSGFTRRLLHDTNPSRTQEISKVRMGSRLIRIPSSPVRSEVSTSCVYKDNETNYGAPTSKNNESYNLHRRFASDSSFLGRMPGTQTVYNTIIPKTRFGDKLGEIAVDSVPADQIPRPHNRFSQNDIESSRRKSSAFTSSLSSDNQETNSISRVPGQFTRENDCISRGCGTSTSVLQDIANGSDCSSKNRSHLPEYGEFVSRKHTRTTMVGALPTAVEWETNEFTPTSSNNNIRCINGGLGSPLWTNTDRRQVDSRRKESSYQLPGTISSFSSITNFCTQQTGLSYTNANGQHNSHSLCETQRRDPDSWFITAGNRDVEMVHGEKNHSLSTPCTGEGKLHCRLPVTSFHGQIGMEATPTNIQEGVSETQFSANNRSVCFQNKPPSPEIRSMETGSRSDNNRCLFNNMDERTSICVSALLSLATCVEEGERRQSNSAPDSTNLDHTNMVSHASRIDHNESNLVTTMGKCAVSASFRPTTSTEQISSSSGLVAMRRRFRKEGLSQEVIDVMLDSCRSSTHKQYESAWAAWCSWCQRKQIDPVSAPVTYIMDFLVECEKKGLSYRTLGVYRSAISLYHEPDGKVPIGQSTMICKLMKGFFNRNPPKPKYAHTWEVEPVLTFIRSLPPVKNLPLKMLTFKAVLLLALSTLGRVSSLVHIDIKSMSVSNSCLRFVPTKLYKHHRPAYGVKQVVIQAFEDGSICPVATIAEYISRTSNLRGDETQLFVSHQKPHHRVVSSTISRWIIEGLALAGVDTETFRAHSTRGAAASCSQKLGVSMKNILEAAGWASNSTFSRFYHRPTATSVVAKAVLGGVTSKSPIDSKPEEDEV